MNVINRVVSAALILGVASSAIAESTGPLSPGSITVTKVGSYSWSNLTPTSQASIDGNSGTLTILGGGQTSDEIFVSNFGASVPVDATVVGIKLIFEFATTGLGAPDVDVVTLTMGTTSTRGTPVVLDLPDTEGDFFHAEIGNASDTWGLALTPAIVNAADFGVFSEITTTNSGTEALDLTQIEIFYTLPGFGPRILIIGDSWAAQIGSFNVFEAVLANEGGLATVSVVKEGIGGSTALQWSTNHEGKLTTITNALNNNPTIDIVHINLGGNDLLGWPGGIPTEPGPLAAAFETIADRIEVVVDHIHSIDPTIHVALGSYDYLADPAFNPAFILHVPIAVASAAGKSNFEFINAIGYTHYALGYPGIFDPFVKPIPGGFPEYTPAGGGDPSLPTHESHNDGGIHLVSVSYITYIERGFNEFYRPWLLEDVGGPEIWVDFAHRGDELGTSGTPMNDLTNAATMVNPGGTIKIKGGTGTADNSTPETLTLDKAMRIEAVDGTVTIGAPSARRSAPDVEVKSGFVTR